MSVYTLQNEEIVIEIKAAGAELTSIKDAKTELEYLWCGDAKYWGRQSPVLFPVVGSLKNKAFQYDGKIYPMGQHGFARDMEFKLWSRKCNEIWFVLESDEETLQKYPFAFKLFVGYRMEGRCIEVMWKVENTGKQMLPFSIGGHPAFMCPIDDKGEQTDYYIITDARDKIIYGEINEEGLLIKNIQNVMELDSEGSFNITENLFDNDALVIENQQIHRISLATPEKEPYVTLEFDMPLCGIWSPAKKSAPFVCLEPWCGRCDSSTFAGELTDREYSINLNAGEQFETSYRLSFGKLQ